MPDKKTANKNRLEYINELFVKLEDATKKFIDIFPHSDFYTDLDAQRKKLNIFIVSGKELIKQAIDTSHIIEKHVHFNPSQSSLGLFYMSKLSLLMNTISDHLKILEQALRDVIESKKNLDEKFSIINLENEQRELIQKHNMELNNLEKQIKSYHEACQNDKDDDEFLRRVKKFIERVNSNIFLKTHKINTGHVMCNRENNLFVVKMEYESGAYYFEWHPVFDEEFKEIVNINSYSCEKQTTSSDRDIYIITCAMPLKNITAQEINKCIQAHSNILAKHIEK